jgi:hypothetical protein
MPMTNAGKQAAFTQNITYLTVIISKVACLFVIQEEISP